MASKPGAAIGQREICAKYQSERRRRTCGHHTYRQTLLSSTIICLLVVTPVRVEAQGSISMEYRTKANFLATFPNFIDWPEDAFPSSHAPFLVCVLGEFPFGTSLAEITRGLSIRGRRMEIRWIRKDPELRKCHILFVSHSEANRYVKVFQALQGADVLTVGETPNFLDAGGAVNFSFDREALQFEVNLVAANGGRLRISSRLLVLARRVLNKPEAARL